MTTPDSAEPLLADRVAALKHTARVGDALDGAAHDWFGHMLYVPLEPRNGASLVAEATMPGALEAVGAEMAQQAAAPFDYERELAAYKAGGRRDAAPWRAELHGTDATAGVVRHMGAGMLPQYGVAVRSSAGPAGRRFAEFVRANPRLTVAELRATPEYAVASDYSERNAKRIAASIAGAMLADPSHPVTNVCAARFDGTARVSAAGGAPPLLAAPEAHTRYNDMLDSGTPEHARLADSRDVVYVGNRATPATGAARVLYQRDHIRGFALAPVGATVPQAHHVVHHMAVDENTTYREALTRDARAWRETLTRTYKNADDGKPVSPTLEHLWRTSEHPTRACVPGTTFLSPVAMFVKTQ